MQKTIRIGTLRGFDKSLGIGRASLFCYIELTQGRLSITGVEGPKRNGGSVGSCGQVIMSDWDVSEYAPGWSVDLCAKFRAAWNKWHLNDMRAGSPAQTAWVEANVDEKAYDYAKVCAALTEAGLNPDPNYLRNGKPYAYGMAWLRVDVPQDVVDFLASLPDTDVQPAWV